MLVIERYPGQETYIDVPTCKGFESITVKVLEINLRDGSVSIGIEAPRHIEVVRDNAKKGRKE